VATVKFDISEAEEVARYLNLSLEKVAKRAILATAFRVVERITTVIIPKEPRQPVDRGAFRAAWRAKKDPDGAIVTNSMPYASVIEYGARAENIKISRAMIMALAAWVLRKGLVKKGKGAAGKQKASEEAEGVAWAIARSMKKKGIFDGGKGLRILEKAMVGLEKYFAEELARELGREYD
jgi:hypothetical protein